MHSHLDNCKSFSLGPDQRAHIFLQPSGLKYNQCTYSHIENVMNKPFSLNSDIELTFKIGMKNS